MAADTGGERTKASRRSTVRSRPMPDLCTQHDIHPRRLAMAQPQATILVTNEFSGTCTLRGYPAVRFSAGRSMLPGLTTRSWLWNAAALALLARHNSVSRLDPVHVQIEARLGS